MKLTKPIHYLASPYTSHKKGHLNIQMEERARFEKISEVAARLINLGIVLYAPISQSVPIAKYGNLDDTTWEYWKEVDLTFLSKCTTLIVCTMEGWKESIGVREEIEFAEENGLHIVYMDPDTLHTSLEIEE